ncbi:dihydrofolate reductase family protein [Nocardiopsis sediminis]|uniref:Dihydrofolate reductase family protein n=1 Tax=Nocardiopsis sediminis TaxID=1778267 RepID=A0ABV8FQM7_9ACTN
MADVFASLGMSLDGYIAGPNAHPGNPLGDGGTRIHQWMFGVESWRDRQGLEDGRTDRDDAVVEEGFERAGAYVMGRRMFDEGEVAWGDPPPFHAPVFVLTSSPREPWVRQGGTTFTFVTDGVESALAQARTAAGGKDVQVSGGASAVRQFLNAGLIAELELHIAPLLLGGGVRLLDGVDPRITFEPGRVVASPAVTHLRYRVMAPSAD